MDPEEQTRLLAPSPEFLASVKVFPLIPQIRKDATKNIDSALSWEQLTASDVNFAIVRPLVFKYARLNNMATVYACLVVRSHFLSEGEADMAYSGVMIARANFCEILAMKLLSRFSSEKIQLVAVLTAGWSPLAGAPPHILGEIRDSVGEDDIDDDPQCALEMAIATEAKWFLSSPQVQAVVNDIYAGDVVFSMTASHRSVLADNYKPKAIEIYDYRTAPFLNHYRLRVPKYGAVLEFLNFALLLITFVLCLSNADNSKLVPAEIIFIIFAIAFVLEEYTASKEHGWGIYIANMWNVFDASFGFIFLLYLALRIKGLASHDEWASSLGFDILSCGACILFPRLAFFAMKNNVVILALRAMIAEFVFFIGIAAICFSGLLFTLHTLASDKWTFKAIAWLMVQIWFGNTYLSFGQASSFHPVFGPILMTGFAALSNTLLLTILISILSNTFARIDANANREYLFQFTISTIEGVKSDALFSYQPPFNLFAFIILWPLSCILSPRALHSVNVFMIRLTSFPILIVIGLYERYFSVGQRLRETGREAASSFYNSIKNMPILEAIVGSQSSDLYDAIFDVELSSEDELFNSDEEDRAAMRSINSRDNLAQRSRENVARQKSRSRTPGTRLRTQSASRTAGGPMSPPRSPMKGSGYSPGASPLHLPSGLPAVLEPGYSAEIPSLGKRSPLARLFAGGGLAAGNAGGSVKLDKAGEASLKKLETLLEDVKDLPVNKLKDEMKELQDRQARIENLLLTLTRGMRGSSLHRDDPM